MKRIIQDYTTNKCSESRMIYAGLQNNPSIQPYFWGEKDNISAYDLMDSVKPDLILINALRTNQDLVHYLAYNNTGKNIILKIPDDVTQDQLVKISGNDFVKNHVLMTISKSSIGKIRNIKLNACVDNNIQDITLRNKIPLCIVTETGDVSPELLTRSNSFHILSNTQEKGVDLFGPNVTVAGLYKNYDMVIFDKIKKFEQPFFDSLYRTKTFFTSDNSDILEKSVAMFDQNLNIQNEKDVDFTKVKNRLEEKHMSTNRVKQLLSQMPIDQSVFTEVSK